jgi:glyoxylase I family protein
MASITGFHHVSLRTEQFDRSIRFYTEILGMKVKVAWGEKPRRAMIDAGDGNYVEVFEQDAEPLKVEAVINHFALRTDDCAAILEKVRAYGSEITMETRALTLNSSAGAIPITIAFFKGPDGELIELFENKVL